MARTSSLVCICWYFWIKTAFRLLLVLQMLCTFNLRNSKVEYQEQLFNILEIPSKTKVLKLDFSDWLQYPFHWWWSFQYYQHQLLRLWNVDFDGIRLAISKRHFPRIKIPWVFHEVMTTKYIQSLQLTQPYSKLQGCVGSDDVFFPRDFFWNLTAFQKRKQRRTSVLRVPQKSSCNFLDRNARRASVFVRFREEVTIDDESNS